jgi:hypothetical protein
MAQPKTGDSSVPDRNGFAPDSVIIKRYSDAQKRTSGQLQRSDSQAT